MILIEPVCDRCGGDFLGTAHLCDMELTHKAQEFALNTWLVDYPSEWTYGQIIELLDDDNFAECNTQWRKVIVPTVVAQDCAGEVLAVYIQTAFKRAMGLIGEVQRG